MNDPHERLESIFAGALEAPPKERAKWVAEACGNDRTLLLQLLQLLQAHDAAGGFLAQPIMAAMTETAPGTRIGRYQLREIIGEGGLGVVFLAEQAEPFRRQVALKIIKPGMDSREVIGRFESERQALALMEHPGITRVFDAGTTPGGRPYFVMELVRGISITQFCDAESLSIEDRVRLFVQVCHAISHAHGKGIIHRDIKPPNILVARSDGVPVPKVIDFGIAKATAFKLTDKTVVTALAHFMGTPSYMSPEQADMGTREIDARSDIYSLGALLHELLTGRTPFDARQLTESGLDEMRRRIREEEPPRPSTRMKTLGGDGLALAARQRQTEPARLVSILRHELDWVVLRCLEKDPARRYQTAGALAVDLQRYLQHERVSAVAPSVVYAVTKRMRRHRTAVLLGAAAVITTLAVASAWWRPRIEPLTATEPVATEKTIAVLAFEDHSVAISDTRLADRISEELMNVLERVPGLRMQARTSSFLLKGQSLSVPEIARRLGVAHVVEGSVAVTGGRVTMTPRLLTADGVRIWSDTFTSSAEEAYAKQSEIAGSIARALRLEPGPSQPAHGTRNPEVHRLVLEGRYFWSLRNAAGFQRADEAFSKALALEPDNAEAHAGLASMCVIREQYRVLDDGPVTDDSARGRREAGLAIQSDATLAEPYLALGYGYYIEGKFAEAQSHFERAATLNPNSAHVQLWYALFQSSQGKLDQSLTRLQQASELDPLWFINLQIYNWELPFARRFERALEINERAAALRSDPFIPHLGERARILLALGRTDEAVEVARFIRQNPDLNPRWHADGVAVWVLQQAARAAEATAFAEELLTRWPADSYRRGIVHAALDRFDDALPYLQRMPTVLFRSLYWEDMWEPWRDDPRFHALLLSLGCANEYQVARATLTRLSAAPKSGAAPIGESR